MPSIRITDNLGAEILTTTAEPTSGLAKYFKGETAEFLASAELVAAIGKPISSITSRDLGAGLTFDKGGTFGTSEIDWTISASAPVSLALTQHGDDVPGDEMLLQPIVVPAGKSALSLSFAPTLSAEIGVTTGDLRFGFDGGASVAFRAGRMFDAGAGAPQLGEGLLDVLKGGIIPGNIIDLNQMRPGDFSSVAGSGHLLVSGAFNLSRVVTPLASPTLLLEKIGSIQVDAGASLDVQASVGIKGMYQIRVQKASATEVRIGYYKMSGFQFQFEVEASAGVSVDIKDTDLLEKLLGLIGAPKADIPETAKASLTSTQLTDVQDAVEASLSRSIAFSLSSSFAASKENDSVFEYVFDLNKLGNEGTQALQHALQADLSLLTSRSSGELPAGVHLVQSLFEEVRSKETVWKVNLLGIVNVLHIHKLVTDGKVLFNPDSGELLVTDAITGRKIMVGTRPLEADSQKVQKLLLQSLIITAAVRASGLETSLAFSGTMTYFEQIAQARRENISDYLDNFVGALLITPEEKSEFLRNNIRGRASVLMELELTDSSVQSLFFDSSGQPHSVDHYEAIARMCMERIIQPGDENDFRRLPVLSTPDSEALWQRMRRAGPAALNTVLPEKINRGQPLALLRHDYLVMSWWIDAMAKASGPVSDMRAFLKTTPLGPEALRNDPVFLKKRKALSSALAHIVGTALPDFVDAWGLLVMYTAARRLAGIRGILVTTGPVLIKSREGAAQHA